MSEYRHALPSDMYYHNSAQCRMLCRVLSSTTQSHSLYSQSPEQAATQHLAPPKSRAGGGPLHSVGGPMLTCSTEPSAIAHFESTSACRDQGSTARPPRGLTSSHPPAQAAQQRWHRITGDSAAAAVTRSVPSHPTYTLSFPAAPEFILLVLQRAASHAPAACRAASPVQQHAPTGGIRGKSGW